MIAILAPTQRDGLDYLRELRESGALITAPHGVVVISTPRQARGRRLDAVLRAPGVIDHAVELAVAPCLI